MCVKYIKTALYKICCIYVYNLCMHLSSNSSIFRKCQRKYVKRNIASNSRSDPLFQFTEVQKWKTMETQLLNSKIGSSVKSSSENHLLRELIAAQNAIRVRAQSRPNIKHIKVSWSTVGRTTLINCVRFCLLQRTSNLMSVFLICSTTIWWGAYQARLGQAKLPETVKSDFQQFDREQFLNTPIPKWATEYGRLV